MKEKIILLIASVVLLAISYKNISRKKKIVVPAIMDIKMKVALPLSLIVLLYLAYVTKGGLVGLIFALSFFAMLVSISISAGFTEDEIIYFGGGNILMSKKKISDLFYVKSVSLNGKKAISVLIRGNLLKKELVFESRFENKISKLAKENSCDFYPRGKSPEKK